MTTLNVSLPKPLRKFVDEQVARGDYATASEYIRALIRQAQKQAGREWLEAELLKGVNSGPGREMTAGEWADIRRRVHQRLNPRGRK